MSSRPLDYAANRPITDGVIEAVLEDYLIQGQRLAHTSKVGAGAMILSRAEASGSLQAWGLCRQERHPAARDLLSAFLARVRNPAGGPTETTESEDYLCISFLELTGGLIIVKAGGLVVRPFPLMALSRIVEYLASPVNLRRRTFRTLADTLAAVRRSRSLTQVRLGQIMGRGRITVSAWEIGMQLPSAGQLMQWLKALGLVAPPTGATVTALDITDHLLSILREDPNQLRNLSPEQFEKFIATRFDLMGFAVTRTGGCNRKDGGIDIIATPKLWTPVPFLLAVQVKHHEAGKRVGRTDVDRLLAWKGRQFHLGMLVTNSRFTEDARWLAAKESNRQFLRLRDFEDLKRWLEENFASEMDWREIPTHVELAPRVIIEVPRPGLIL